METKLKSFVCSIAYSPLVNNIISSMGVVKIWADLHVYSSKKKLLASARNVFKKESSLRTFDDYKQALKKQWVTYNEYANQYEFYKKLAGEYTGQFLEFLKDIPTSAIPLYFRK